MTREEAYAELIALRRDYAALAERVARLEGRKRKPTPEEKKTDQNRLAELWTEIYGGKPLGVLFSVGTEMIREYGWERVERVLRHEFRRTRVAVLSLQKIQGAFPVLEREIAPVSSGVRATADDRPAPNVSPALDWIESNGGREASARLILKTAKQEDGHNRLRNAITILNAPEYVLGLLGQDIHRIEKRAKT